MTNTLEIAQHSGVLGLIQDGTPLQPDDVLTELQAFREECEKLALAEQQQEIGLLDEIGVLLEDVEYKGSYVEGIKSLLVKAKEEGRAEAIQKG